MGLLHRFFGPPSRRKFADLMIEAIRKTGVSAPIEFIEKDFKLLIGKDHHCFLNNIYAEYCAAPKANRSAALDQFAKSAIPLEVPDRFEDALPDIVPRIRERIFYSTLRMQCELQGHSLMEVPPHTVIGEHFALGLGYDGPNSIVTIDRDNLKKWGIAFEELVTRALGNLRASTTRQLREIRAGYYKADWKDNYDASRALLLDFI